MAADNTRYTQTCADASPSCVAVAGCTNAVTCASASFESFSGPNAKVDAWKLKADASCITTTGGKDLTDGGFFGTTDAALPSITRDYFGASRTAGFSRGAHEQGLPGCTLP